MKEKADSARLKPEALAAAAEPPSRVLVVDDDPSERDYLCHMLEAAGYTPESAADGAAALRSCSASPPDVVLLDIVMPGVDGIEVCRRLKETEETAPIPVLLVTAEGGDEHRLAGMQAGANDFLTKPVDHRDLMFRVRNMARLKHLFDRAAAGSGRPAAAPTLLRRPTGVPAVTGDGETGWIFNLLKKMVREGASDLHLGSGCKPCLRIDGDIIPLDDYPPVTAAECREMICEVMPDRNRAEFDERKDTDFGLQMQDGTRFRVNVFLDYRGAGAVFRVIPSRIPTADDLGLPAVVRDLCSLSKGLVVVTGPTGSGKSTTLAAMLDLVNRTRADHVITIEDPIEFIHKSGTCLVNQREVHAHTENYAAALRAALREDPDIILIGEMRDLETIEIALETAETGHLVFGTLHTSTAAGTVDRLIDKFPANQQNQIRTMLAGSLKAVVAQTLCRRKTRGRVAALEVLVVTPAVATNIREGKTFHIPSAMQVGKKHGMQLLGDELIRLVREDLIEPEEAYRRALDKDEIAKKLAEAGVAQCGRPPASVVAKRRPESRPASADNEMARWQQVLAASPDQPDALNNLAWLLATHREHSVRDGRRAVEMAERAFELSDGEDARVLDTLGASYAETGDFERAAERAGQAIHAAVAAGDHVLAAQIRERLSVYESGSAFRAAG